MRTNRVLLAAAASVLAFALTGCGSDDPGPKVPTAGGGEKSAAAPAGGGKDEVAAYVEGKRAWVRCMRENGVELNDPDEKGQIDFGGGDQRKALKQNPKYIPAQKACESVDPPMPEDLEKSLNPLTPEEIKVRKDYADCMRKNGAPDFPDPKADGSDSADAEWDQSSAGAKRAARICGPIIGIPDNPPPAKG